MQNASSNIHISSSTNFWYWGEVDMVGSPVVGISILHTLVLPTSVKDLDMMLSNSFPVKSKVYP